jgi:hypothetical protein
MTISDLVPNLQPLVQDLSQQLRFVCYFILTGAIIVRTSQGSVSISQLVRPIVTNIILCGLIATLPMWFNLIRDEFWNIAVSIRKEFTGSVDGTGAALMQLIQPPDNGIDWLDVGNSLMKAVQYALGWLIVWIGGLIQLPMMIVQFVMECLCYLFLPIALSLFAFESTKGLAIRYIQQTLAILAWPIGFAVVDLVGYSLLTSSTSVVSAGALAAGLATGFTPAKLVIGGIVPGESRWLTPSPRSWESGWRCLAYLMSGSGWFRWLRGPRREGQFVAEVKFPPNLTGEPSKSGVASAPRCLLLECCLVMRRSRQ